MPELLIAAIAVSLGLAVALIASRWRAVTILEYQQAIKFTNGRFVEVLGGGRHRIWHPRTSLQIVDMREAQLAIPGQELVTRDGVSVKLSLAVRYRIADPRKALTEVESYLGATYVVLQVALREVIGGLTIDDVLSTRDALGSQVGDRSRGEIAEMGVDLLSVKVKDLMFPGPMKKVFAQVIEARQQGLASLEKARGETAALRSLANAARMVDASPSLLQLRLLQQLASSAGNTLIVGLPQSSTPLPVRTDHHLDTGPEIPTSEDEG